MPQNNDRSIIDDIKAQIDLREWVDGLQNNAGRMFRTCPFHGGGQERTPSMMVEADHYFCHACLPPTEQVRTDEGLCPIGQVNVGDMVWTHKGRLRPVVNVYSHLYKGELVNVRVRMSNIPVRLTPNHKVPCVRTEFCRHKGREGRMCAPTCDSSCPTRYFENYHLEWVEAGDLTEGDWLLVPVDTQVQDAEVLGVAPYKQARAKGRAPRHVPDQLPLSDDLLWLIGLYIAEGSTAGGRIANWNLGPYPDLVERTLRAIDAVFGIEAKLYSYAPTKNMISCCNTYVCQIMEGLCGVGAAKKQIPPDFIHLPVEKQQVLLQGYIDGDGHVRGTSTGTATVSDKLACQVRDMLLRAGTSVGLHRREEHVSSDGVNHQRSYNLHWTSGHSHSWIVEYQGHKYAAVAVRKIERESYHGEVCNLTVEEDHSYQTASFAVANCQSYGDIFDWLQHDRGMDFNEALAELCARLGIALDRNNAKQIAERAQRKRQITQQIESYRAEVKPARDYLLQRGISVPTQDLAQIGYAPEKHAVVLPFCDPGGRPIGESFRMLGKNAKAKYLTYNSEIFKKSDWLWGLQVALKADRGQVWIVEGQIDAMSLWEIGIRRAVATVGSTLSDGQIEQLLRYFPDDEWVFVCDNKTENDWGLFERSYQGAMKHDPTRLCRVCIPPRGTDVNDCLVAQDLDWLEQPQPVPQVQAQRIVGNGMARDAQYRAARELYYATPDALIKRDLIDIFSAQWEREPSAIREYFEVQDAGEVSINVRNVAMALDIAEETTDAMIEQGWHMGFPPLKKLIPYPRPRQMMGIVTRPSVGKTTLAVNLVRKQRELKIPTLLLSYEQPANELMLKLALATAYEMNRPVPHFQAYQHIYNRQEDQWWSWIRETCGRLYDHVYFSDDCPSADQIGSLVAHYSMRTGTQIGMVIIDYLGVVPKPSYCMSSSAYETTTAKVHAIKDACRASNAFWVLLHQTSREGKDGHKPLGLDAGKDSGAVEEVTDYLLTMWMGEKINDGMLLRCDLVKNKFGQSDQFDLFRAGEFGLIETRIMPSAERESRARMAAAAQQETWAKPPETLFAPEQQARSEAQPVVGGDMWAEEDGDPFG